MNNDELKSLCYEGLHAKANDGQHELRLNSELKEICAKNETDYFLDLHAKNLHFAENEHNLIIPYLLGIVSDFDIAAPSKYNYGDSPDVDVDYIDDVRGYLKEDFAKDTFGEDKVCNIANYNTFGLKSAIKDMARIFNLPHKEVNAITDRIKDKDDEGKPLSWDETLEEFKELREYCEAHPEVADGAKRLMGRIRSRGQHASGLVISNVPIRDFIPLVCKDGSPASAWIEGLHGTDLSTVGFVKFDFLGLDGNSKIATACKMACKDKKYKQTEELLNKMVGNETVCALDGQPSWSDTSYLDDSACMKVANAGHLRLVFQFDGSPGIRRLAKDIGVTCFDDLVATTALFRPGPMKTGLHERYIKRKRGKEDYVVHPLLAAGDANLSFTYGVPIYQEQIMRMLNAIGGVPMDDCEKVRKAISKKKVEAFIKYKTMFVENGKKLGLSDEELHKIWNEIEAFATYGFNLSHSVGYTYLSSRMLWLKVHLPRRFYASMFTHTKASSPDDYEKLKQYKFEAKRSGVKISGLDINRSKKDFAVSVDDDVIYYGFNKIRGIGDKAAARLEELQPYVGIEDFLTRYGTEAKVVQPLIALGCFQEKDRLTLYKFYEHFKKFQKSEADRIKRFEKGQQRMRDGIVAWKKQLDDLLTKGQDVRETELLEAGMNPEDDDGEQFIRSEIATQERKLERSLAIKQKKDEFIEIPALEKFDPESVTKLNKDFLEIIESPAKDKAELEYYGYVWQHPIEKCPGYQGLTFEDFLDSQEPTGEIECLIKDVKKTKGKNATYYKVQLEDATGRGRGMNVWENDYQRFEDLLEKGKCVRMSVDRPKPPYPTFTLHQVGRYKKIPIHQDYRVVGIG